jgi:hypothetical protein
MSNNTIDEKILFLYKNPLSYVLMSKKDLREFLITRFSNKKGNSVFNGAGRVYEIKHSSFGPDLYKVWLV